MGIARPRLMARKAWSARSSSQSPCWQSTMIQSKPARESISVAEGEPSTALAPIAGLPASSSRLAVLIVISALTARGAAGVHGQVAAIHGDEGASDPGRGVRGQENGQSLDVVGLTEAA